MLMEKDPPPLCYARPREDNILECLIGLLSFMCTDELTTGSVLGSQRERRTLAAQSHAYNLRQKKFLQLFPDYAGSASRDLPNMTKPATTMDQSASPSDIKKGISTNAGPCTDSQTPSKDTAPTLDNAPEEITNQSFTNKRVFLWTATAVTGILFVAKVIEKLAM
ncbi:E2 ubiquitin-conjugating enzyme [Malassezia yamatoensis]|uniref:E2 ubiquitin-conjugating enzyme n=1 Tax=Malassezia yamatoensis TaxID=253288 RepID=A0AAJ6CID0_9BASI|nr:E2 ubiquitin-conjugating enzyme [Malassezia yamatoensis]